MHSEFLVVKQNLVGLISSSITGILGHRNGFPELKFFKVQAVDKSFDLNQI